MLTRGVHTDTILISCAGLGMGNASRVIAIVEALTALARENGRNLSVHILTWGSAFTFLREYQKESDLKFELIETHPYAGVLGYARAFVRNVRFLRATVRRLRPGLIILDSDYHFPAYFGAGCPIFYIGQAHDVLQRARATSYRPGSWRERLNFNFKEKLDSYVQGFFASVILVPTFKSSDGGGTKIRKIPLIVRKEFLGAPSTRQSRPSVGILLSGSEIEKSAFLNLAAKYGLQVLTPSVANAQHTVPSHASTLDQFDIIFTQGGLSSISECIARAKFVVVFPISRHPEQMLNAVEVEQLGLGMRSSLQDLERFPGLLEEIVRKREKSKRSFVGCNGAEVAAGLIFRELAGAPH
jgi:hypothetical protein